MQLCMFHPNDQPLERGWVGRVDGDRVVHLAAQTLQHFFTGGSSAREHAEYPLAEVTLLAPVLQPPSVRVFEGDRSFAFANPAAVTGPGSSVVAPTDTLVALPRLAAIVGAPGAIGGVTALLELRAPQLEPPKDRDFALLLGPLVVTADELGKGQVELGLEIGGEEHVRRAVATDWDALAEYAGRNTVLRTGDVLAGPAAGLADVLPGASLVLHGGPIGSLACTVAAR
jgi:fumarylacetoacetate (FAA) hydrolase